VNRAKRGAERATLLHSFICVALRGATICASAALLRDGASAHARITATPHLYPQPLSGVDMLWWSGVTHRRRQRVAEERGSLGTLSDRRQTAGDREGENNKQK